MGKKVELGVLEVAKILQKSPQFVRVGLQRGFLDFGCAFKLKDSGRYNYVIYPEKFYQTIGVKRNEYENQEQK